MPHTIAKETAKTESKSKKWRKGYGQELKFSLYVITHPFNGFWDIKHEKKGSIRVMWTLLIAAFAVRILGRQLTGYLFNSSNPLNLNVFVELLQFALVFVLWCTANWCLTSLMDGEGSYKDICMATAYAMVPYILLQLPAILLSNILSGREEAVYSLLISLSYLWTGFLLFFGMMVTHQYTLLKTIITAVLTLLGMAIIIFIGLLFMNLLNQMVGFAANLYQEVSFRNNTGAVMLGNGGWFRGL